MSENKPYKCTKCGYNHAKGKVYEAHKEFAEKKDVPASKTGDSFDVLDKPDVTVKVETTKEGVMTGTATSSNGKVARVVMEPKMKDDQCWTIGQMDEFLLKASKKQINLMTSDFPWVMRRGARVKANWRVSCWETPEGGRVPFSIDEMTKYAVLTDKAGGTKAGILKRHRAKKAIKDAIVVYHRSRPSGSQCGTCEGLTSATACGLMSFNEIMTVFRGETPKCPKYKRRKE